MQKIFNFDNQYTPQNYINIDNIGDCCIEGINEEEGFSFFLKISTNMGQSTIISYGPVIKESNDIINYFNLNYQKIDYKEQLLVKIINMWLNDKKKKITAAYIIDNEEFLKNSCVLNDIILK